MNFTRNIGIVILFAILLSSCLQQDDSKYFSEMSNSLTKTDNDITTTKNTFTTSVISRSTTKEANSSISITKNKEEGIFEIFPQLDGYLSSEILVGFPFLGMPYYYDVYYDDYRRPFEKLITEEEFRNWFNNYQLISNDYIEKDKALRVDINEFANIYSLIYDFGLSEKQVREALAEWNKSEYRCFYDGLDGDVLYEIVYSEEEINALALRNKTEIIRLFAWELALIKNDKIYVPGWFFHSSIEDYEKNEITAKDIIKILNYRKEYNSNCSVFQYFYDVVEYKANNYLKGNIDAMKLCGYERDFSMPMAYDAYYISYPTGLDMYCSFFNYYKNNDNSLNIFKGKNTYSPHWIYYNKPAAYKEAGITGKELIEMLPKYKELGILSDEAYKALEEKIYDYAESFEE